MTPFMEIFAPGAFILLLMAAAVSDLLWRKIPNWTVLGLVGLYIILAVTGMAPTDPWSGVAAAAISLPLTYGLYHFRVLGAGDAKLFSAAALFAGLAQLLPFALITGLLGGALAIGFMIVDPKQVMRGLTSGARAASPSKGVPYAIPIIAGALVIATATGFLHPA